MTLGPLMIDVAGHELTDVDRELLRHPLVGSVILFTRNYADPAQLARLCADIHALRSPPLIIAVDHEGGRVQRFRDGFTRLPALRLVGRRADSDRSGALALARQLGWLMAAELRAVGVDLSFAPCVDLDYGLSEVIGDRALHADPARVGELAVAYMHGMRDAGMAAVAKHFPGHGAVVADSHVALPVDRRELVDLDGDLAPYRLLIANGLPAVMIAHVLFPQVDERPASLSPRWVQGVLRGQLGFDGAVFTDDLSMAGAAAFGPIEERARLALAAGCDVLPVCNDRAQVARLLDRLDVTPAPVGAMRQVRLHGRPMPQRDALLAESRWQEASAAAGAMLQPPPLQLDA